MKRNIFIYLMIIVHGFFVGFGQTIQRTYSEYQIYCNNNRPDTVCCLKYTIENLQEKCIVVLLSKDELNDSIPEQRQIYRTICRPYKDFCLSFFAWEANLNIEPMVTLAPQWFVKIIEPRAYFDVFFETKSNILRLNPEFGLKHIQILSEDTLRNNGLKHFIDGVRSCKADYKFDFILFRCEDFFSAQ